MFVCEKCHDGDMNVLECGETYDSHGIGVWGDCDICGKGNRDSVSITCCSGYDKVLKKPDNREK